jgi:hypothetical protein
MTARAAVIGTAIGASVLAVTFAVTGPRQHMRPSVSATPRVSASPAQPAPPAADQLLPVNPAEISRAAQLARQFVAVYGTYRYDETPNTYLNRLTPMMDSSLRPLLEHSARSAGLLAQRRAGQTISTGDAWLDGIRALTHGSIIFLVTGVEHVTASGMRSDRMARYAVTVTGSDTGSDTDGWTVTAIELASIGDTGGGP